MWRKAMGRAYSPEAVYARYEHQTVATYPNRIRLPNSKERLSPKNVRKGLGLLRRILWQVGVKSDYRDVFWRFAWPRLKRGDIEAVIRTGLMAHHMIVAAREAASGKQSASHYTARPRALEAA